MKSLKFISGLLASLICLTACSSSSTELGLANKYQTLPMPTFVAEDNSRRGGFPKYAQIRVYEIRKRCSLPNCPVIWDVIVPEQHSPTEFVYGGFPGFGSQTVIAAHPLKPNQEYLLMTIPSKFGSSSGTGEFYFRVKSDGSIVPK